ncbi:MAG TPA: D-alanyl-D-alanine carboxypeptidase/D-alanyl-D-alanine-endopeptidase, partial [Ilumatobacteraceae bacterium]|nr:D-alanyl-D-alanine carboxypeptidase/D-alanyl-D-alanine-endopeptidase [Ilumatobacteraceae bacterium]
AGTALASLLTEAGIQLVGGVRTGALEIGVPEIASVTSPPLSAIVADMLTISDDNTAELLLKEIAVATELGDDRQAGLDAVVATLTTWGIDTSTLTLADGSGLSSTNQVTCDVLLAVLDRQPADGPLRAGLPIAGQTGTLAAETAFDESVIGRLHAKTGTLTGVKALAGFVTTGGGELDFALILNGDGIKDVYQPLWGRLGQIAA